MVGFFFFFNDTATTEIYTLSLHDALPISPAPRRADGRPVARGIATADGLAQGARPEHERSEEHTSELQSPCNLVCRLLLEKKKKTEMSQQLLENLQPYAAYSLQSTLSSVH